MPTAKKMTRRQQDDTYRAYRLIGASWRGERTKIGGVTFALGSEEISPSEWQPTSIIGYDHYRMRDGPMISFPWTTPAMLAALRLGKVTEVRAGDLIRVRSVERRKVRAPFGPLDHPDHQERRLAFLQVQRANGDLEDVVGIWEFRGAGDAIDPALRGQYDEVRHALTSRLQSALQVDDVEDVIFEDDLKKWPDQIRAAPEIFRHALLAFRAAEEGDEKAAMTFGYLMGRAEAERTTLPPAQKRLALAEQRRRAAKLPRRRGDETREVALQIIEQVPGVSRRKCSEKVAERRGLSDIRSIEQTIGLFFKKAEDGTFRPDQQKILNYQMTTRRA